MWNLRLLAVSVFLSSTFAKQVTSCSNDCFDYHRICPAVKNGTFYDEYKQLHQDGKLDAFNNAQLPPKPDCNNVFYKYACPRACGECTVCEVADLLNQLEEKLIAADKTMKASLIAKINAIPVKCNPCTEKEVELEDGQKSCSPKYEIIYELTGKCSCSCGIGTQWKEKKCVAYEQKNDKCEQVSTLTENCPRGGSRKYTIRCNNGDCVVKTISERTSVDPGSATNDVLTYRAVTAKGESCELGVIGTKSGLERKQSSQTDNYFSSGSGGIEHPQCRGRVCLAEGEVFEYIEVTTNGNDAWKADNIQVTVNERSQTYTNSNWLTNQGTLRYTKLGG